MRRSKASGDFPSHGSRSSRRCFCHSAQPLGPLGGGLPLPLGDALVELLPLFLLLRGGSGLSVAGDQPAVGRALTRVTSVGQHAALLEAALRVVLADVAAFTKV